MSVGRVSGAFHERGTAGAPDPEQAIRWYKKAASNGHTAAEAALGRLLYHGVLVERDITQALHFLQRAAAKVTWSRPPDGLDGVGSRGRLTSAVPCVAS